MKKLLSLLVVLALVITMVPAAFAAEAAPVITGQPEDVTAYENALVKFTVEAEGENLAYQWQYSKDAGTTWRDSTNATEGYNAKTLVLSAGLVRDGWMYRCVVSNAAGSVTSNTATLSVIVAETKVEITSQPKDATVPEGSYASFTVEAVGDDLSYQWQFSTNDGKSWKYSSEATQGYNEKTLVVKSTPGRNGYSFRCIITTPDGATAITKKAKLTMGVPVVDFEIKSHPQDVTAFENALVTFTVEAEGEALKYQWQYSKDAGKSWINSTNATEGYNAKTLVLSAGLVRKGWMYRCVVSNASGSAITEAATLSVVEAPSKVEITSQPKDATVPEGSYASFTVEAIGDDLSYQWQFSTNDGKSWKYSSEATQGYNEKTLVVKSTPGRNGYSFRCIITKSDGATAISKKAKMTMGEVVLDITINNQPADVTAVVGTNATFTVEAEGENLTYQWQYSKDTGASWRNSSEATQGYNEKTLVVAASAVRDGWLYRCVVTNETGSITSEAATLTVITAALGDAMKPEAIEDISFIMFSQEAGDADGYHYVWEAPAAGIVSFTGMAYDADYNDSNAYDVIVNGNKLSETDGTLDVTVAAGEAVVIQLIGNDAAEAHVYAYGSFANGTIDYPFALDPDNIPGTASTKEIAAGATQVYATSAGNVNMVINSADISVVYKDKTYTPVDGVLTLYLEPAGMNPITRQPEPNVLTITNAGAEPVAFTASFAYPAGHVENPAELQLGDNTAVVAAGTEGYYYTWVAEEDGVLTVTMPDGDWFYVINNLTAGAYGDWQYSDSNPVVKVVTLEVAVGDEISLNVNTYDPNAPWSAPAGQVVFSASFEALSDTEIGEDITNPDDGEA